MVYKWYILPIGGLYATYHLLGKPETTIESTVNQKNRSAGIYILVPNAARVDVFFFELRTFTAPRHPEEFYRSYRKIHGNLRGPPMPSPPEEIRPY